MDRIILFVLESMQSLRHNGSMRVLVTGSTSWTDRNLIHAALSKLPGGSVVVTGDTDGVDAIAIDLARELGLRVEAMRKSAVDAERFPGEAWKGLNDRMIGAGIDLVFVFFFFFGFFCFVFCFFFFFV